MSALQYLGGNQHFALDFDNFRVRLQLTLLPACPAADTSLQFLNRFAAQTGSFSQRQFICKSQIAPVLVILFGWIDCSIYGPLHAPIEIKAKESSPQSTRPSC